MELYNETYHESEINDKTFLITGGAGFIGSNIVEYLLKYNAKKVVVLDNFSTGYFENISKFVPNSNFKLIKGDIRNYETCENALLDIDLVCHQAALGSVPRSIANPIQTNEVNINGFLNLLYNCIENKKIKRFVYAASSSTYGDSIKLPKKEDFIGKPLSPYAVTKYVNELYADVFHKNYNIDTIGLRYFNVFGPNQSPNGEYAAVIPKFIDSILNNLTTIIHGDGTQTRDFTFVENAVQANIKALTTTNTNALNNIYNIAFGQEVSLNEVYNFIIKYLSKPNISPKYIQTRKGDIKNSLADINKAKNLLNYNPTFNFKKGLEYLINKQIEIYGN